MPQPKLAGFLTAFGGIILVYSNLDKVKDWAVSKQPEWDAAVEKKRQAAIMATGLGRPPSHAERSANQFQLEIQIK